MKYLTWIGVFFLVYSPVNLYGAIEILIGASREEVLQTVVVESSAFRAIAGSIGSETIIFGETCDVGYIFKNEKVERIVYYFRIREHSISDHLSVFDRVRTWIMSVSEEYSQYYRLNDINLCALKSEQPQGADKHTSTVFNFKGYTDEIIFDLEFLYDKDLFEKIDLTDKSGTPFLVLDIKSISHR